MSRKTAREVAMKIAFANLLGGDAQYMDALSNLSDTPGTVPIPTDEDMAFADELKNGVSEKSVELDETIKNLLRNWDIERLPKIDLVILRIALYELIYEPDVPRGAIINEAVRLAKKFGSDDSSTSYINGILGAYVRGERFDGEALADEHTES